MTTGKTPGEDGAGPDAAIAQVDFGFAAQISRLADTSVSRCFQCQTCSNGCPFSQAMDYRPNALMRLVQLGMREAALACSTIWICVGCHTCSSACPMGIDIAAVMDALRQMALHGGVPVAEPGILNFHRQVLDSIARHGRTHKLEIMLRYKAQQRDFLADFDVGLRMLAKRKLDLRPSNIQAIDEIKPMFKRPWQGS